MSHTVSPSRTEVLDRVVLARDEQRCEVSCSHDQDLDRFGNDSLEALQNAEQRKLMDLVDGLRRNGLNSILPLPQIVVCGDQSSGKSSVLEAITEIPFPQKENLCTRFATEISLRNGPEDRIHCSINASTERNLDDKQKLGTLSRTIASFEALPGLIEEATSLMGLGPQRAFSKDVLRIEICGPRHPELTLIDLPGLIHTSNKTQSKEDVDVVRSLVEDYISKERTIILAVISAKNDYANQIILKMCRDFDRSGSRTLGIITKPDFLRQGSENEGLWLDLSRNRDIVLELGWHLLRNRADDERDLTFAERNHKEQVFFQTGKYSLLPDYMKGVDTLRDRLSHLLFKHLKKGLPSLQADLNQMLSGTSASLDALGASRSSLSEQRVYLADLATSASTIIQMAVTGVYTAEFFDGIDAEMAVNEGQNAKRLRAVIQHLNMRFAENVRLCRHAYSIEQDANAITKSPSVENKGKMVKLKPSPLRERAIERVMLIQERIRGLELPGMITSGIITYLFTEQAANWKPIARNHVQSVASACQRFVHNVLDHVSSPEVSERLYSATAAPALQKARDTANEELNLIFEDMKRHPITYNHYFTDTLQKKQRDRHAQYLARAADGAIVNVSQKTFAGGAGFEEKPYIDPVSLQSELQRAIQPDMEKFGAEQALDVHDAYYKDEQKYFVAAVTKQVIERRLVQPLHAILAPRTLAVYTDDEVRSVAMEPQETVQLRTNLQNKKKILEDGQEAFQAITGQFLTG